MWFIPKTLHSKPERVCTDWSGPPGLNTQCSGATHLESHEIKGSPTPQKGRFTREVVEDMISDQ